ncbi:MAG TPA: DNA-formamidopyrimidine glycosylase family protein [Solirubrobacterales bacterium]|nr:DNA-formamidopyrimidine glycosylase family protein [Solirubrobacterales bacterium]
MAEGDTILRLARRIGDALGGEEVAVESPNRRGRAAEVERLNGGMLLAVKAHGKHLLFDFGDRVLHSHLGMSGSWHLYSRGERWRRPARSAWAVLSSGAWSAVQFGGPTLRVLRKAELKLDPALSRLGADILAAEFDLQAAARALRSVPERAIGDALLDQTLVVGIGNIFKSEACFAARADPFGATGDLSEEELESLLAATRRLMVEAVSTGRRPGAVYRRAGRPCKRCDTPIAMRGQGDANRTTYWCPRCQGSGPAPAGN